LPPGAWRGQEELLLLPDEPEPLLDEPELDEPEPELDELALVLDAGFGVDERESVR
jgi:hypothetical protein